jgi:membrane-bound lytic murein transglycosylase B
MRWAAAILCVVGVCAGCTSHRGAGPTPTPASPRPTTHQTTAPKPAVASDPAVVPVLADEPSMLARQLAVAEQAVRAPGTSQARLLAAARTAQAAYRRLALHPDWDRTVLASVPASLRATVVANVRAQRELQAIKSPAPKDVLLAWRIEAPAPAGSLLAWYHAAGARFGVQWQYLAAINLIETTFGKIHGLSPSAAQGPMQFLPATWAVYGAGGDVTDPHDAIFGAARYLADHGFAHGEVDGALYAYNPTVHYANAVKALVSVLVADPRSFDGYYRWDVYYPTSSGLLLLPQGFSENHRTSAAAYARAHPERVLR